MIRLAAEARPSEPRQTAAGFTLVELLVGLTLFALLSALMFGGFRIGVRAWEAGGERINDVSRVELAQNLLRRQLSEASLPQAAADQDEFAASAFRGAGDALSFLAPLPAHSLVGGLYVFSLAEAPNAGRAYLRLGWKIFRPENLVPGELGDEEEALLLDDIASLDLAYYGRIGPDRPPTWTESWSGALGLPQLIRLRVRFPAGDPRQWPDLVVAPRLYAPPAE